MTLDLLISPSYLAEQVKLHGCGYYGSYSDKWIPFVSDLVTALGVESVLDYGCGQGKLGAGLRSMGIDAREYDPSVPAFSELPEPADLVFCSDVLEHVEPDRLSYVLAHLKYLTMACLYTVIATRPATRRLSDGRNAHLIIESSEWWRRRIASDRWLELSCDLPNPVHNPALEVATLWRPTVQNWARA